MADVLQSIVERAKKLNKNVVLTEGEDARVVKAAAEAAAVCGWRSCATSSDRS